jgi:hypothetical protein
MIAIIMLSLSALSFLIGCVWYFSKKHAVAGFIYLFVCLLVCFPLAITIKNYALQPQKTKKMFITTEKLIVNKDTVTLKTDTTYTFYQI